jgi:hypothetical protein
MRKSQLGLPDSVIGVCLLAFSLLMIFFVIPRYAASGLGDDSSLPSAFMPTITMVVVAAASALLIAQSIFAIDWKNLGRLSLGIPDKRLMLATAALLVAAAALPFVGMLPTVALLAAVEMWLLGERRWYALAAMGVSVPLFFYVLFQQLLGAQLP